ncbi:hypothetical protein I317_01203 [Kwoniella heveanensis CBS 569]|uniref:GH16 domain-containing protein n=1 Tax=Kwoniella heveanensis BCC8398 TaxID=1296120 RepID=A0A1B9GK15_9TREE|nr:hypothetical protein I316_06946 [Kwoniella heveanensis BCC8398]OCF44924.1 hypothetical protein I317_01203 [Kwoniella heveanensis CBS 569]
MRSSFSLFAILSVLAASGVQASTKSCSAKTGTGSTPASLAAVAGASSAPGVNNLANATTGVDASSAPSGSASAPASGSASVSVTSDSAVVSPPISSSSGIAAVAGNSTASSAVDAPAATVGYSHTGKFSGVPDLDLPDIGKDCECGYKVKSLDSFYFRKRFSFDFSSLPTQTFSSSDALLDKGWIIKDSSSHVGGPSDVGNQCLGDPSSLSIEEGALQLTVKAGQTLSSNMKCPEISHTDPALHGVFQAEMQLSAVEGTCQAFWLNHTSEVTADELDIEVIGGTHKVMGAGGAGPGIYSTSWEPSDDPGKPNDIEHTHGLAPFPDIDTNDPTETFNKYTIAWLPSSQQRYYNGIAINTTTQYNAVNPMNATINNWSNGFAGWSGAFPTTDSVLKVKTVLFYYNTETEFDLKEGCSESDVCEV